MCYGVSCKLLMKYILICFLHPITINLQENIYASYQNCLCLLFEYISNYSNWLFPISIFYPQEDRDSKTIDERLLELHIEESLKDGQAWCSHLNPCANLLSLVCRRERFNRLILTLYPSDESNEEGFYSVHLMTSDGRQTELLKLPYEEDDFLTCVDNQVRRTF